MKRTIEKFALGMMMLGLALWIKEVWWAIYFSAFFFGIFVMSKGE